MMRHLYTQTRRGVIGVAASLSLFLLPALARADDAKPTEINLGNYFKAVDYAPYLVAKSKGWFDEEFAKFGLKVNFTEFQETPAITEAFGSKRIDFVVLAEVPALIVKASNIDVRTTSVSSVIPFTVLVAPDSSVQKIADLKGKKIAVLIGTGTNYGLLKALTDAGLTTSDVELLNLGPADAKAAFEQGHVDAWAVWPPFVELEETTGKGRVVQGTEGVKIYSIAVGRGDLIDAHPEFLTAYESVLDRARAWVAANKVEAQKITGEGLGFEDAVITKSWDRNDFTAKLTPDLAADFQAKADFLSDGGFVSRRVDVVKERFLPAAN